MQNSIRVLGVAIATLLAFGCASSTETKPTHYWESTVSKRVYQEDNGSCGAEDLAAFDAESDTYESYRDCMISKGYTLRTY